MMATSADGEKLLLFARDGDIRSIDMLISKYTGTKITEIANYTDRGGNTPLIMASYYGRSEVVEKLLKLGADTSKANEKGVNALLAATKRLESVEVDGKMGSVEHSNYSRIVEMLKEHADKEQMKAMARRSEALASSTIAIFPSFHNDNSESAELKDWIRQRKISGKRIVVAYEMPADEDMKEKFSSISTSEDLDGVIKNIMPEFRDAQRNLLEGIVAEGVQIYPFDLKNHKMAVEHGIFGLFIIPSVISEMLDKGSVSLEKLLNAEIATQASTYIFNESRNAAMAHNAKELAERNAPCTLLVICGSMHAPALESKLSGSGIQVELARDRDAPAVRSGKFSYDASLAGYNAATNAMLNNDELTLLRSLCLMLEIKKYKGTNPKDNVAIRGKALDSVEKLYSRDKLIELLGSRVPSLSLESRNTAEMGKRIRNV